MLDIESTMRALTVLLVATIPFQVRAHSWVEQLMQIAPNGTFVGEPGYARGNVQRSTPGFSDTLMTHLIPPNGRATNDILPTDAMCMQSQKTSNQTAGSPKLKVPAGASVALRYQENGHVTLPWNQPGKPANRGYVYVYGTQHPKEDDTLLEIHNVWNANGTGGDGRGVLLSKQNFDDGQCYQINNGNISEYRQQKYPHTADELMGANLWCQQDLALPSNLPSGKSYTLYWVWDWPTAPHVDPGLPDGKNETYTTCIDIEITHEHKGGSSNSPAMDYVAGQSLDAAAIPSEFSQIQNASQPPSGSTTSAAVGPGAPASSTTNSGCQMPPSTVTVTQTVTVTPGVSSGPGSQSPSSTPTSSTPSSPGASMPTLSIVSSSVVAVSALSTTASPSTASTTFTTSTTPTTPTTPTTSTPSTTSTLSTTSTPSTTPTTSATSASSTSTTTPTLVMPTSVVAISNPKIQPTMVTALSPSPTPTSTGTALKRRRRRAFPHFG